MPSGRLNEGLSWWIVTDTVDTLSSGVEAIFTAGLTRRGDARSNPENSPVGPSWDLAGRKPVAKSTFSKASHWYTSREHDGDAGS